MGKFFSNLKSIKINNIVLILILLLLFIIFKYCTYCLIFYEHNVPTSTLWNCEVTTTKKVLNSGFIIGNSKIERLSRDKLVKIRQLVKELKENVKNLEQKANVSNRFTIDGKTYAENSLDSEGKEILSQILTIIYGYNYHI